MPSPYQLTLRSTDHQLRTALRREARRRRASLNRTVLALLRERLGLDADEPDPETHDDLDHLAGTWSQEQAKEFDEALREQRQIDEKLWR